jgi:Ca-activated chloride channel family protein
MAIQGFTAPGWFALLAVVAAAGVLYVDRQRRRRRHLLTFANLGVLERIAPRRPGRWRHLPPALLGVALALLIVALAGPQTREPVPRDRAVVLLVIDVSLSMNATDVTPTRLLAAEDAATRFVAALPPGINLGLESFSGTAEVLVAPTTYHDQVSTAISRLQLGPSTATGDAIAAARTAIGQFGAEVPGGLAGQPGPPDSAPPARIVLMSDGKQTVGRDEFTEAAATGAAHIPISTISFGTPDGVIDLDGTQVPVPVADDDLQRVANLSGGQFYPAHSSADIHQVYDTLSRQIGYQTLTVDTSRPWLAAGVLLALAAVAAGLVRDQRLPG